MAVQFFRINEHGGLRRPTIFALGVFSLTALVTLIVLRNHPIIAVFIVCPAEYILCALIFSKPLRVSLGRFLHWTRYPYISTAPQPEDDRWVAANKDLFDRLKISLHNFDTLDAPRPGEGAGKRSSAENIS